MEEKLTKNPLQFDKTCFLKQIWDFLSPHSLDISQHFIFTARSQFTTILKQFLVQNEHFFVV